MKKRRVFLSLRVLIPFIFAGTALLGFILACQLTYYYLQFGQDLTWPLRFWGLAIFASALGIGYLLTNLLLKPVEQFVDQAKQITSTLYSKEQKEKKQLDSKNEIDQFIHVFDQVSQILSRVEAKSLFPEIIGQSKAIRGVLSQIIKVAPTNSTVLITGESGTGKELVANSIHRHSQRNNRPFIKLNCVAIPKDLLESELFGYEKGAFTGADKPKKGKFELANGGTIFLDEIGDMPLNTQAKLLRVLQEREFERLGGTKTIKVDVRIIAATNKDLPKMIEQGTFRQDLFYRLNVFPIHIPALRERLEDIPLLVENFLNNNFPHLSISDPALQILMAYPWPGNVRELQNTLERAVIMASDKRVIDLDHLPSEISGGLVSPIIIPDSAENISLDDKLAQIEKGLIIEALKQSNGVQKKAAEILGIKVRSLWHRIKKYEIDVKKLKD
ncbi:sigma-54 interaction domain-containing protein [Desulfovulcanus sp.]